MIVWASSGATFLMSLRSPPAKNVFFAEVMTTPAMLSCSAWSRPTVALIDVL
jgi:hypothetical protein